MPEVRGRLALESGATFEGILFCRGGRVTDVNGALARLGGWDAKQIIGRWLDDLFVPEAASVLGLIGLGARTEAVETALLTHDGTPRPVELLCRAMTQDGEQALVVAVRDISERKAAEQRIGELAHYDIPRLCGNPEKAACQSRLKRFCLIDDPAWLPGQRIARRPD